jgi:hypothetical protein
MHAHDVDEVATRAADDVKRMLNRAGRLTELAEAEGGYPGTSSRQDGDCPSHRFTPPRHRAGRRA